MSHDLTHPEALPLTPVPPRWVEELLANAAPHNAHHSGVQVRTSGPVAYATTGIHGAVRLDARELREKVASAYRAVIAALESIDRHPARFWNFIPEIGEPMVAGLDRYMVFNTGRHDAYSHRHGAPGTASAVGITGSDLSIHCLAMEAPGTPVENPRQTPAWQYSARYGPLPPCFSRATIVDLGGRPTLLIGGTASVVGEDSRHAGDFDAQLDETLLNLEALIGAADASPYDRRPALHRLVELQVYVCSAEQAERAREKLATACPRARNISVALAQVCRRELLIEIEGVAELQRT